MGVGIAGFGDVIFVTRGGTHLFLYGTSIGGVVNGELSLQAHSPHRGSVFGDQTLTP